MATETGQENGGSSLRNLCCIFDIYDVKSSCWRFKKKEITLRSREERRWQEERVSRQIKEMRDMEAVHLVWWDCKRVFMIEITRSSRLGSRKLWPE